MSISQAPATWAPTFPHSWVFSELLWAVWCIWQPGWVKQAAAGPDRVDFYPFIRGRFHKNWWSILSVFNPHSRTLIQTCVFSLVGIWHKEMARAILPSLCSSVFNFPNKHFTVYCGSGYKQTPKSNYPILYWIFC